MSKYYIELKTTSVSRWEVEAEAAVVRDENFNVILRLFRGEDNKWKK